MRISADPNFEYWATGYSGCDGGNIDGRIWFCGIEFGGGHTRESLVFEDVSKPPSIPDEKLSKKLGYQYNQKVAKLNAVIRDHSISSWRETAKQHNLFSDSSDIFKLNLYPVAFKRDAEELWEPWLFEITGLPTKSIYRAWCQLYRFPKLKQWLEMGNPKLIVATGLSYADHFNFAFSGNDAAYNPIIQEEKLENRRIRWRVINDGKTVLAVVPFLGGASGLNSDAQLTAVGQRLRQLCNKQFGSQWLGS